MVQRGLSSFRPTTVILTHERKVQKYEAKDENCWNISHVLSIPGV